MLLQRIFSCVLGVVGKIYINAFYPAALDSLKRKLKFAILAFVVKMSDELKWINLLLWKKGTPIVKLISGIYFLVKR